jgi:hypothetical protein
MTTNPKDPDQFDRAQIPDPFDPANLRLDQSFTETVPVKKLLTTIPVRRPSKQSFFRVHPDPAYRGVFPVIDLKDDQEEYLVAKPLVQELATEIVVKQLCLAITRQGTVFFLPLRLPGPDGKDMKWWSSLREHAKYAETRWIRIWANRDLGAYEAILGDENLSAPEWPDLDFWALIKIAFRDFLVTDLNHPVVRRPSLDVGRLPRGGGGGLRVHRPARRATRAGLLGGL